MPLKTPEQYWESLRRLKRTVYIMGEEVPDPNDHPIVRPSTNAVAKTYELAQKPEYQDLMTARSPLTGQVVNRFCHIQGSIEDMIRKVKMLRLMGQQTATCFQRCAGLDCMNSLYSITYDMDRELGTEYHKRYREFLKNVQNDDLVCDAAMTDGRGDRSLAPHEQADPDRIGLLARPLRAVSLGVGHAAHQHDVFFLDLFQIIDKAIEVLRAVFLVDFVSGHVQGVEGIEPDAPLKAAARLMGDEPEHLHLFDEIIDGLVNMGKAVYLFPGKMARSRHQLFIFGPQGQLIGFRCGIDVGNKSGMGGDIIHTLTIIINDQPLVP